MNDSRPAMKKVKITIETEVTSLATVSNSKIESDIRYRMEQQYAPFRDLLVWFLNAGSTEAKFTKVEVK